MTSTLVKLPNQQITEAQFRQFLREYEGHELHELVDGWIKVMAEPSGEHESVRSLLYGELFLEIRQQRLNFEIHPKALCRLEKGDHRRPDLIVVDKTTWRRNTQSEAILKEPPILAIEIVSTNWEEDYIKKALWYAAFGVAEYWVTDLLLRIKDYPKRKHPNINIPTVSVGTLQNGEYQWQRFTGQDRIISPTFPNLNLTVEQIIAAAEV